MLDCDEQYTITVVRFSFWFHQGRLSAALFAVADICDYNSHKPFFRRVQTGAMPFITTKALRHLAEIREETAQIFCIIEVQRPPQNKYFNKK